MKIITVIGARPQFIKAASISRIIKENYPNQIEEKILHTGQHYDSNMSEIFFKELKIPDPDFNLNISSFSHGAMTGKMLEKIEEILINEKPDIVMVYGDTNSTLAGSLAASKLNIPIVHIEAGLRSFNRKMPEEINRIITDHISTYLFCPSEVAKENLSNEGVEDHVMNFGDVMFDAALFYAELSNNKSKILENLGIKESAYSLVTLHRSENTDNSSNLESILKAIHQISRDEDIVFPIHPRTKKMIETFKLNDYLKRVITIDPVPFLDMIKLTKSSKAVFTDSGGVQKESFFYDVPCITLREETEWLETVTYGKNILAGSNTQKIIDAFFEDMHNKKKLINNPYGDGNASLKIVDYLKSNNI